MKTEIEIGLETRLFNNSISFDINYYSNTSTDQIFAVPVASSSGYTSKLMNAGSIQNSGIEIQLGGRLFESDGFTADLNVNWSTNKSEVLELAPGVDNIYINGFTGSQIRAVAGQPYGTIYGGRWKRNAAGEKIIGSTGYPVVDSEEGALGAWIMLTQRFSSRSRNSSIVNIRSPVAIGTYGSVCARLRVSARACV